MNVLITGSGRGIGRALALAFAEEGHNVVVNARSREEEAKRTVEQILEKGGRAVLEMADVSKPREAEKLVEATVSHFGSIDGLVNNAGVTRDRSLLKMSEAEWNEVMSVNLSGAFWCLQAAAARMVKQKEGFILNVSSIIALRGAIGAANYTAAKAGLIGLTKAAAKELGRFNVRVNAVLPGFHLTEMGRTIGEEQIEKVRQQHALGRTTDLEELSRFVVQLARQKSVAGQIFNFDSRVL